jgi:hypothetical protein
VIEYDEPENMWKEEVGTCLKILILRYPEGLRKATKKLRIARHASEIRTGEIPEHEAQLHSIESSQS